jgi:ABC-type nitrate/sulfonate/bicarbonate transport system substrate-binding protein
LGWQIPWATQGQLVQILKHTDIAKKHNLEIEFIGRTFGPQLNELALANQVDLILTADQPALTLFSKNKGWVGIGRLMYNRTSLYVPYNSKIKNILELKGKVIGVPVGAAAERNALAAVEKVGLNSKLDVKVVNLDIREQIPLIKKDKTLTTWDGFDALAGFDPIPAVLEFEKLIKVLDVGKVVSLVVMNQKFKNDHKGIERNFLLALRDAYSYYRQHVSQANAWFVAEAQLENVNDQVCALSASLEPNLNAKTDAEVRLFLNKEDFAVLGSAALFLKDKFGFEVDPTKYIDDSIAKQLN